MSSEQLILIGAGLAAISGVPGLCLGRRSSPGQWLATLLMIAGCGCGLAGIVDFLLTGQSQELSIASPIAGLDLPLAGAKFAVAVDHLSVVFLFPVFIIPLLGSIYGMSYWKQADHPDNGQKLRLFYGLLTASLAMLVVARTGIMFLAAWEAMALSAFFLVATEDQDDQTRNAGWLYLAASHFATLCLFALFGILASVSGTFELNPLQTVSPGIATAVFLLALLGFGMKAGIMPLHFWLPSAHAMAPSHVSALMSGVLIKMGVYGLVRVCSLLPVVPAWWGGLLLVLGVVSGILGMAFAISQHDLKRMLAYSSVENIGIIFIGLGLALLGRALNEPKWIVLGLGGALWHVWNHALFKSLLFFTAGSIIHATHTREIDRMGGLAKRMPWTTICFVSGAVAVCGLPPLNGFVSEFLLYLGLFRTLGLGGGGSWFAASFAVPALALIGSLALACFVNAYGTMFLGNPRSEPAGHAHEADLWILMPLGLLAAGCLAMGLAPSLVAPVLDAAMRGWQTGVVAATPPFTLETFAALTIVTNRAAALLLLVAASALLLQWRLRAEGVAWSDTWGCGYAAPNTRMQYTSSSFSEMLVKWFRWALFPRVHSPKIHALFPGRTDFQRVVLDTVLNGIVLPGVRGIAWIFSWSRLIQQGNLHAYLLYVFAIVIFLLLWR